jgi:hypothetical protein
VDDFLNCDDSNGLMDKIRYVKSCEINSIYSYLNYITNVLIIFPPNYAEKFSFFHIFILQGV